MSRIISFRGQVADSSEETIPLHTIDGSIGYRLIKFEVMTETFVNAELLMRIWKTPGNVGAGNIDFSDNRMLAAAQFSQSSASESNPDDVMVIFDSEIFNQDIYITNNGVSNSRTMNYYIELEQMKLDLNENTVATLKDIRNVA